MLEIVVIAIIVLVVAWGLIYMLAQKPVTLVQKRIHENRYAEAVAEADKQLVKTPADSALLLHRAEALKLMGRFDDAIVSYREALRRNRDDAAAREGIALSLSHLGRDLDEAKEIMEQTIASYPQIQEFQALALAWILLRRGDRAEALRLFEDNRVLIETRFKDDYTDPDPLLAETLVLNAALLDAAGDSARAAELRAQAAAWAPGSVWHSRESAIVSG
ncbi:MAG TPA: tetratricopeptide repeat protein [Thermoanaerobaculia bacterium]|nr:tetratricopeptide repeat protein [Thermoanaerobaculia bacterium]